MTHITPSMLEQVGYQMSRNFDADKRQKINLVLGSLKMAFRPELVGPCIEQFVDAELDYISPGNRGVGRLSTYIPRLGAYYRGAMSQFPEGQKAQLRTLLENVLLAGYITAAGIWEDDISKGCRTDPTELFKVWVSLIYVIDATHRSNEILALVREFTRTPVRDLEQHMDKLGMRGGLLRIKRSVMLGKYVDAGLLLRRCETVPEMRDLHDALLRSWLGR